MREAGCRVLIVDDEETLRRVLAKELERRGHVVATAPDLEEGLAALEAGDHEVLILDMRMPGLSGVDGLKAVLARDEAPAVIVLTGHGSIDQALECVRLGAADYATKPCSLNELDTRIRRAADNREHHQQSSLYRSHLSDRPAPRFFVGNTPAMQELARQIERVAPTRATVLITGESGVGKELVALAVHRASPLRDRPYVTLNCGALQTSLMESELFGHERGAFTGANRRKPGLFELAHGGTLFLDEVGEMPAELQVKLLRFLQFGELRRVGGTKNLKVSVRIIAATNRDLDEAIAAKDFREDLYYRLNTVTLRVPALRKRSREDVRALARQLLAERSRLPLELSDEALTRLAKCSWPGNVRELGNCIERLAIFAEGQTIGVEDVERAIGGRGAASLFDTEEPMPLKELERRYIQAMLLRFGGRKREVAEILGISLKTLYNKIHLYALKVP